MPSQQFLFSETSPAAAGTAASSQPVTGAESANLPGGVAGFFDDYDAINVVCDLVGATGGTLDVYVQISPDQGSTWYDVIHYPQLSAGAAAVSYDTPLSNATTTTAPQKVGKGLSPALPANAAVNGAFSDRMRLVMVAGAGTSAGAAVIVRAQAQRARLREAGGD